MAGVVRAPFRSLPDRLRHMDQRALVQLRYDLQGIPRLARAASDRAGPPHRQRQRTAPVRPAAVKRGGNKMNTNMRGARPLSRCVCCEPTLAFSGTELGRRNFLTGGIAALGLGAASSAI